MILAQSTSELSSSIDTSRYKAVAVENINKMNKILDEYEGMRFQINKLLSDNQVLLQKIEDGNQIIRKLELQSKSRIQESKILANEIAALKNKIHFNQENQNELSLMLRDCQDKRNAYLSQVYQLKEKRRRREFDHQEAKMWKICSAFLAVTCVLVGMYSL